jgi:hypothetical protein
VLGPPAAPRRGFWQLTPSGIEYAREPSAPLSVEELAHLTTVDPDSRLRPAPEPRPYDDSLDRDGLMVYRYRGTDPLHRENVGLRLAMQRQTPLVYLFGIIEGLPKRPASCR